MSMTHRLAIIMFSDIVGYTATTQLDETEAARQVREHRKILDEVAAGVKGEILQHYGDGSLSLFNSAHDAVLSALEIQERANTTGIPLRIGIHLGEIRFEDDQFIGDGINVASRIQSISETGDVVISKQVYDLVQNQPHWHFRDLGEKSFKNVSHPVSLFSVRDASTKENKSKSQANAKPDIKRRKFVRPVLALLILGLSYFVFATIRNNPNQTELSIAVLPFTSLSDNTEDQYFSEGISDDIRSKLAAVKDLDVKSRSSSAHVVEQSMSAQAIRKALDVGYLLEGSLRPKTTGAQLNIALTDAVNDKLVKPFTYEINNDSQFFSVMEQLTSDIIETLGIEETRSIDKGDRTFTTTNLDAHRYYLLGRSYMYKSASMDDLHKSEEYLRRAIDEDPGYARAYATLAEALLAPAGVGYEDVNKAIEKARPYAMKAIELNDDIAETQLIIGTIFEFETAFEKAESALQRAIVHDPSLATSYLRLAKVEVMLGKTESALHHLDQAVKLDPLTPLIIDTRALIHAVLGNYHEALRISHKNLELFPNHNNTLWQLALSHAGLGNYDKAIEILLSRTSPNPELNFLVGYCYGMKGDTTASQEVLDYLLQKQENTYVPPSMIGAIYYSLGDTKNPRAWLARESHYLFLMLPIFRQLWYDPEYADIYSFVKVRI